MDPFIIIKNHRQARQAEEAAQAPRLFLRELDPNTLGGRGCSMRMSTTVFSEEDKENCMWLGLGLDGSDVLKGLPSPSNNQLINYSDYDMHY